MSLKESFEKKRLNFCTLVPKHFDFLESEFGYHSPTIKEFKQSNNTVILDEFIYTGKSNTITISNAYHPNDYGFEITIKNPNKEELLIHSVLKENQTAEQSYLKDAATTLNSYLNSNSY